MTKQELTTWAAINCWSLDRFGHFRKTIPGMDGAPSDYRLKLSRTFVRLEVQVEHPASEYSPASKSWARLKSGSLKRMAVDAAGKLSGLVR